MSSTNGLTHAVVLSGGASQGAYHAGVLRALFNGESPATDYRPLRPDVFTGTSAGSVNAAALLGEIEANNPNPTNYIEQLWLQRIARTGTSCGSGVYRARGNPARFFDFGCLITNPLKPVLDLLQDVNFVTRESVRRGSQFVASTNRLGRRVLDQINLSSFVAMDPFQDVLQNSIRFDLIQRSKRFIRIGAVRWDSGFIHYFTNSDLTVDVGPKIVQASSALPGFFPRVSVNGVEYADGGVIENSPLQGAVEANADVLHVVTSLPQTANIPADLTVNTLDTLYRMLVINVTKSLRRDIERYRNVNDALLVLRTLRESGNTGTAHEMLKQLLDRIMRQDEPDYRRVTIHVYAPPEPMATLFEFVNFDREYLEQLVRKGYHDTLAHNCKLNGCVVPEEHIDPQPTQPPDIYGDETRPDRVDPGLTF